MEHVTWKLPGPTCGWFGRILYPDPCISVSSWSKVPLLSVCSVAVHQCRPLLPCLTLSRWHGALWLTDWLTDWLYLHNKTLQINSEIENYNVQDRKEWTHWQLPYGLVQIQIVNYKQYKFKKKYWTIRNSLKSILHSDRRKRLRELNSTISTGKLFHIFTTRQAKNDILYLHGYDLHTICKGDHE